MGETVARRAHILSGAAAGENLIFLNHVTHLRRLCMIHKGELFRLIHSIFCFLPYDSTISSAGTGLLSVDVLDVSNRSSENGSFVSHRRKRA